MKNLKKYTPFMAAFMAVMISWIIILSEVQKKDMEYEESKTYQKTELQWLADYYGFKGRWVTDEDHYSFTMYPSENQMLIAGYDGEYSLHLVTLGGGDKHIKFSDYQQMFNELDKQLREGYKWKQ